MFEHLLCILLAGKLSWQDNTRGKSGEYHHTARGTLRGRSMTFKKIKEDTIIKQASITATIYREIYKKSIRCESITHNMKLSTKIILDETKTMDISINNIMQIFIDMEFPEIGNISL